MEYIINDEPLPRDKMPQCWSDDQRMNALFAPFRFKSVNPESWNMKMKFWSDMFRQWCTFRNDCSLTLSKAKQSFRRNGSTPACLDIVIDELTRSGEIVPASKYSRLENSRGEGWVHWGVRQAFRPAGFAVGLISSMVVSKGSQEGMPTASIDPYQQYVIESVLKTQASDVITKYPSDKDRVGTFEEILVNAGYRMEQKESFSLVLSYLLSNRMAYRKGDLFKLADLAANPVTCLSESEEAAHKLRTMERKLETQSVEFRQKAEKALGDAQGSLAEGNKVAAKSHLRRRKHFARQADNCDDAADNIRQLLFNLQQQHTNTQVLDTYRTSVSAMKQNFKDNDIDEDRAHETMDELRDILESYGEVEKALSGSLDDSSTAELEDELEVLMATSGPAGPAGGTSTKKKTARVRTNERDYIFDGEARMIAELNDLSVEDKSLENPGEGNDRDQNEKTRRKPVALAVDDDFVLGKVLPKQFKTPTASTEPSTPGTKTQPNQPWYQTEDEFIDGNNENMQFDQKNSRFDPELTEFYPKLAQFDHSRAQIDTKHARVDRNQVGFHCAKSKSDEEQKNRDGLIADSESWRVNRDNNTNVPIRSPDRYANLTANEVLRDQRLHPGQPTQYVVHPGVKNSKVVYDTDFLVQDHNLNDGVWTYNPRDGNANPYTSPKPGRDPVHPEKPAAAETHNMNTSPDEDLRDLERRLKNLKK